MHNCQLLTYYKQKINFQMICEWSFMSQTSQPNSTLVFSADKIYLEEKVQDKCYDYIKFTAGKLVFM